MATKAELISLLGRMPIASRVLRWYARKYPEGSVVNVKSGVAAGLRWRRHHRYVNGYWTGHYELEIQEVLRRDLSEGDVFWDIGANAGFFSLVARSLVGHTGGVVSVDPDPENHASITEQIGVNDFGANWHVEQVAAGAAEASIRFQRSTPGSPKGHLVDAESRGFNTGGRDEDEVFDVPVTTLDTLLERHRAPDVVKLDVEGAEILALEGAARMLSEVRPLWLIELHGPVCERSVRDTLTDHGYVLSTVSGEDIGGDTDRLPKHIVAKPLSSDTPSSRSVDAARSADSQGF